VLAPSYLANQVKTYPLNSPTAPAVVVPMSVSGGLSGPEAPVMVGALVKHNVVRRGKGSQSRSTFSPVTEAAINTPPTQITGTYAASLTAAFIAFINGVEADVVAALGGSCAYVQLSKGTPLHAPATYVISASAAELLLTTQRRRAQR